MTQTASRHVHWYSGGPSRACKAWRLGILAFAKNQPGKFASISTKLPAVLVIVCALRSPRWAPLSLITSHRFLWHER